MTKKSDTNAELDRAVAKLAEDLAYSQPAMTDTAGGVDSLRNALLAIGEEPSNPMGCGRACQDGPTTMCSSTTA